MRVPITLPTRTGAVWTVVRPRQRRRDPWSGLILTLTMKMMMLMLTVVEL
jgi:hypothetical protein